MGSCDHGNEHSGAIKGGQFLIDRGRTNCMELVTCFKCRKLPHSVNYSKCYGLLKQLRSSLLSRRTRVPLSKTLIGPVLLYCSRDLMVTKDYQVQFKGKC
jgi:hypothetical protein